ncbi:MAG: hypothetical protein JRF61_12380 [Deltaproteobacteria bacterium]|nr:hypothetical protein [Deltaproteobacteria bacterium]
MRRALTLPLPEIVMDGVVQSTAAIAAGRRLVFAEGAVAPGPSGLGEGVDSRRKVRNACRGLRAVFHRRALLNPFRTGFQALQPFTHKALQRLLPLPLFGLLIASAFLEGPLFRAAFVAQLALHGLTLLSLILHDCAIGRLKLLRLPFFLDMLAVAIFAAAVQLALSRRAACWTPAR